MGVGAAATGRLQVALDDRDAKELVGALDTQSPVYQQDTLALHTVQRDVTGEVNNGEVAPAGTPRIHAIAPVRQDGLVANAAIDDGLGLVVAGGKRDGSPRGKLG